MSNHPEFSPASLRLIKRKYGAAFEVTAPDTDPSLALQSFNASLLQDGALGVVYASTAGGTNQGYPRLFIFKRAYAGPPVNATSYFTPIVGGGLWVQMAGPGLSSYYLGQGSDGPITMTAGGGETVLHARVGILPQQGAGFGETGSVDARVILTTGAVAGSTVSISLQTSTYTGAPSWSTQDNISGIVMLANQYMELNLKASMSMSPGDLFACRVVGTATGQDAISTNCRIWTSGVSVPFGY